MRSAPFVNCWMPRWKNASGMPLRERLVEVAHLVQLLADVARRTASSYGAMRLRGEIVREQRLEQRLRRQHPDLMARWTPLSRAMSTIDAASPMSSAPSSSRLRHRVVAARS
jgi:hypothetical protein